jgi:hypothetical protein
MQRNPDLAALEAVGISFAGAMDFIKPEWKTNALAMDAQPTLITTPNSAIPAFLTTYVDPDLVRVLTAKNRAAEIIGEKKKGTFADTTAMFPVIEYTGEVSSYGDHSNNGKSGANLNFPQRQQYIYQTIVEYGDLEMERAGLARVGWATELRNSASVTLKKFQNLTYFFGVAGLQNYGLLNDPSLSGSLTPATKAAGGVTWWTVGGAPNATANEVYNDILSIFVQLVSQSNGLIEADTPMTLALSPKSATALSFTNSFNVNVNVLLKGNFPNLKVETAVQYGAVTASNPQGNAGGELVQLIATNVEGQETGYAAFSEMLRAGPVVRKLSSFEQKLSQGSWGSVLRQPFAIASMLGV